MARIFLLDADPDKAVQSLVDADVIRMPIEISQILLSAWHVAKPGTFAPSFYHMMKDPWTDWAAGSAENYEWLWNYSMDLLDEFQFRFSRPRPDGVPHTIRHGIADLIDRLGRVPPLPNRDLSEFPIGIEQARQNERATNNEPIYSHRSPPSWLRTE